MGEGGWETIICGGCAGMDMCTGITGVVYVFVVVVVLL